MPGVRVQRYLPRRMVLAGPGPGPPSNRSPGRWYGGPPPPCGRPASPAHGGRTHHRHLHPQAQAQRGYPAPGHTEWRRSSLQALPRSRGTTTPAPFSIPPRSPPSRPRLAPTGCPPLPHGRCPVGQSLHHAQIRVRQLHILAHKATVTAFSQESCRCTRSLHSARSHSLGMSKASAPDRPAFLVQQQGHLVQAAGVEVLNHPLHRQVAEHPDLGAHVKGQLVVRPAHQNVRRDANAL